MEAIFLHHMEEAQFFELLKKKHTKFVIQYDTALFKKNNIH